MHLNLAIITQNRCGASPKNGISLEGIIIFLEKILAKTPHPKLLRSIPVEARQHHHTQHPSSNKTNASSGCNDSA
jgi:hypothetical protein